MKLKDVCLNITDGTHSTVLDTPNGDNYLLSCKNVKLGHILINSNDRRIDDRTLFALRVRTKMAINDVVLSSVGTIGEVALVRQNPNYEFQRSVAILKPNTSIILPKYLMYFLMSQKGQSIIKGHIKGAAQPCLFLNDIKDIEIPVTDTVVQRHIVNTIGTVDDLIEKKEAEFRTKMQLLCLLFDKYESQEVMCFGNVFKSFNGGTFQSKYYVPYSANKLITIKNVDDNGFNTESVSYISDDNADKKFLLLQGDIVLTMTGNIGRVGIVDENNCYLNQRVLRLDCQSKSYLFAYLIKYKNEIIQLGKGTAQLNLSLEDLKRLQVHNSDSEIKQFSKYDCIFDSLFECKLIIKKAKDLKAILLNKYF